MTHDYTALRDRLRAYQWGQLDRPHEEAASAIEALQAERDEARAERDRARRLLKRVPFTGPITSSLMDDIRAELDSQPKGNTNEPRT